jgi:hypothetical protein
VKRAAALVIALAACGGGDGAPDAARADAAAADAREVDAPAPDAAPFALTGTLVDGDFVPVANRTVRVLATGETAVTDASGRFTLPGATPPYDLAVWDPDIVISGFAVPTATVYVGLSRPDPVIVLFNARGSRRYDTTNVEVSAPGGIVYPQTSHLELFDAPGLSSALADVHASGFTFRASWSGPPTITGVIRALTFTNDPTNGLTTAFTHEGATPLITMTHATGASADIAFVSPPPTSTVAGTATFPAGAEIRRLEQAVELGRDSAAQQYVPTTGGAFSLLVPVISGGSYQVCARATQSTGYDPPVSVACAGVVPPGTADLALTVADYAQPVTPADGAMIAPTSTFTWTAPPGVSILYVAAQVVGQPSFFVVTDEATATVPDLSALGVPAPATGTNYAWRVYTYATHATVDDAAVTAFPHGSDVLGPFEIRPTHAAAMAITKTASRSFTTP